MAKFAKILKLGKILEAEGDAENVTEVTELLGDTMLFAGDTI